MYVIEGLYLASSAALVAVGLLMVALATRAYLQTERRAMIHLALGFVLVVAAAASTTISAFLTDFENVRSLLVVNSGFTTIGYAFVVYSLVSYE
ncbi:DUF7521 family protein [Halegenticoccus tardaugens]|uniref:DUF7521 family protein n=1 Tax=Halegenticoccus tardaugens TaxID=2071624 RepID=UPI001E3B0B94|nr:hypothetical protein [Halegenticoccus tardaugens]